MNIYANPGDKVRYAYPKSGYGRNGEGEYLKKVGLKLGEIYTVEKMVVHEFSAEVYLEEFPGVSCNTVNFEDVDKNTHQIPILRKAR